MALSDLYSKYKSSYYQAAFDFTRHVIFVIFSIYYMMSFRNSAFPIILTGLLQVKTFIIYHDCGHNSYTPNKQLNYTIGNFCGIFVNFPFFWNYQHHTHHLTNGQIGNPYDYNFNELIFHTLDQYKQMYPLVRRTYSIIRSPLALFTILTYIQFFIAQRFTVLIFYMNKYAYKPDYGVLWFEQIFNNVGIMVFMYILYERAILLNWILSLCISSTVGSLLFICQHTYNPLYVVKPEEWNATDSGLVGSSLIEIPYLLKYFTGGIEYHHIHHMNSKIPNYNLQAFHEEVVSTSDLFDKITVLSLADCYHNAQFALYDEAERRYITFQEADKKME